MASIRSNGVAFKKAMIGLGAALKLDRPYRGGKGQIFGADKLADQFAAVTATAIAIRTEYQQLDPQGRPLASLKSSTLARKHTLGYPTTIGVETHEMLSMEQLEGTRKVTSNELDIEYGTNDEARRKADEFTTGGHGAYDERPFFDLGTNGEHDIRELVENVLDHTVRTVGP